MFRSLGSLIRGRDEWERKVELNELPPLAGLSPEGYAALEVERRNGILARFVASFAGVAEKDAARDVGPMLGLAVGGGRIVSQAVESWVLSDESMRARLKAVLDGEFLAGAAIASAQADEETLRSVAYFHGGVSPLLAAEIALRSRRVRALGRRTLGDAARVAIGGDLAPLAPIAPIGPIRLQAARLRDELHKIKNPHQMRDLPWRTDEQPIRDRVALGLANHGLVPRLAGSFVIDGMRNWVVGIDDEGSKDEQLRQQVAVLLTLLTLERPALAGYGAVALVVCSGAWSRLSLSIPRHIADAYFAGSASIATVLGAAHVEDLGITLSAYLDADGIGGGRTLGEERSPGDSHTPSSGRYGPTTPQVMSLIEWLQGLGQDALTRLAGLYGWNSGQLPGADTLGQGLDALIRSELAELPLGAIDRPNRPASLAARAAAEAVMEAIARTVMEPPANVREWASAGGADLAYLLVVRPEASEVSFSTLWGRYADELAELDALVAGQGMGGQDSGERPRVTSASHPLGSGAGTDEPGLQARPEPGLHDADDPEPDPDGDDAKATAREIMESLGAIVPDDSDWFVLDAGLSHNGQVAAQLVERTDSTFFGGADIGTHAGDQRVWLVDVAREQHGDWRLSDDGRSFNDPSEAWEFMDEALDRHASVDLEDETDIEFPV